MKNICNRSKAVAQIAATAFEGRPSVARYWDDNNNSSIDVLCTEDSPQNGITSFATIGLSSHSLQYQGVEIDVRAELVGACDSTVREFGNVLSSAAFYIINSNRDCAPGVMIPDVLSMYGCSTTMQHILLTFPFLWEEHLKSQIIEDIDVAWLLAVPISDTEFSFARKNGYEELEQLFENHQIDIFDINRSPVI